MKAPSTANSWARNRGYADFDTYIATGNSITAARQQVRLHMLELQKLLEWLDGYIPKPAQPATEDEPTDAANAHIQGAEEA